MFRQKGSRLEIDDEGLLKSGLLVRLLVLPNGAAGVAESLAWIAETLSPKVAISLMAQYYPIHRAATNEKYAALNRSITAAEWADALAALESNGLTSRASSRSSRRPTSTTAPTSPTATRPSATSATSVEGPPVPH